MSKKGFDILFEDDAIVVINKYAGLLSIPDRFDPDIPNAKDLLFKDRQELYVVHRIDRETSGLLCFAKTKEAHSAISLQFEKRTVSKRYHAIVNNRLRMDTGTIDEPLGESHVKGKYKIDKKGKEAVTHYQLIEAFKDYSLVEYELITGRTHQIRVHSLFIGHPIVGDKKYNPRSQFLISSIKKKKFNVRKGEHEKSLANRHLLHAYKLSILHPTTGKTVHFTADYPKDMRAVLNQLKKWNALN